MSIIAKRQPLHRPSIQSPPTKVNAGVSGQTFVYLLKAAFYLCEYVTTLKTIDIVLQPID